MCLHTHTHTHTHTHSYVYTLILYNERPWSNDILVAKSIPVLRSWGSVLYSFLNIHSYISLLVVRIFKVLSLSSFQICIEYY